jgi:GDP-mannose 6-dehydrogenase
MRISIFGLGYVGAVTAGCLAKRGHEIIGVDIHSQKIAALNSGAAPIFEPGLDDLLKSAKEARRLRATSDVRDAVLNSDVSFVCVGTPADQTAALDLSFVGTVLGELAEVLRESTKVHPIIIRSTMLPGSTAKLVRTAFGEGSRYSEQIFYYPEFLREGSAVEDFENPSTVVIGSATGQPLAKELLGDFSARALVVDWATAEMIKFASNAFHATKIAFANEIGRFCHEMKINGRTVMSLLCDDKKLNLSPYYLQPGNPFGGSCLPKDVRALTHQAQVMSLELPLLQNLLPSNEAHLQSLLARVLTSKEKEVVILGLAFKAQTDDLRGSAMVELARALLERQFTVRIFDPSLSLEALVGSNKRVVETKLPQLPNLLHSSLSTALGNRGLIVAAQRCVNAAQLAPNVKPPHRIIDVNGWAELKSLGIPYEPFCW